MSTASNRVLTWLKHVNLPIRVETTSPFYSYIMKLYKDGRIKGEDQLKGFVVTKIVGENDG